MLTGALIVESLRVGTVLNDLDLTVRRLSRLTPTGVTADQPTVWTLMEFTSERAEPSGLADKLALARHPRRTVRLVIATVKGQTS